MAILTDFADLLPHPISWEQRSSVDAYGTPTYSSAQSFNSRVDFRRRSFVNPLGQLIGTTGSIVVGGTPIIQPGDRITLPNGAQPPILDASVVDDENGVPYCTLVTLG